MFQRPSNALPTPYQRGVHTPPHTPPCVCEHTHRLEPVGMSHTHQLRPRQEAGVLVIGIDPGSASGAVAWLHADGRAAVSDQPLIAGALDPHALRSLLLDTPEPATAVYVEHVSAMPRQGVASTFKFGRAVGAIWATVSLAGLRLELVTPTEWKRWHRIGPDKEQARALAIRRFPALASDMARKKDVDRAEALLIGAFGLHMLAAAGAA